MAEAEKTLGNKEFSAGNYDQAIVHFSKAIAIEPNHVFYSNRSACYCGLSKYEEALQDAESCIKMKPDWGKARRITRDRLRPPALMWMMWPPCVQLTPFSSATSCAGVWPQGRSTARLGKVRRRYGRL